MNRMAKMIINFSAYLLVILVLASCAKTSGTETGNPELEPDIATLRILSAACDTLIRCNPSLTESACNQGFYSATEVDSALGLGAAAYSNFQAVVDAARNNQITANLQPSLACATE